MDLVIPVTSVYLRRLSESLPCWTGDKGQTMIMELNHFIDRIDAICKVASGLMAIINLPKVERETRCQTLEETYRLIDIPSVKQSSFCMTKLREIDCII